jgi:FkbM family methyltransferase
MPLKQHHPFIADIAPFEGWVERNQLADCFGCLFDNEIARPHHHPELFVSEFRDDSEQPDKVFLRTDRPPFGEEYFEWIDLMDSIRSAQNNYTMFELGAGFGRWGVRAWKAAKAHRIERVKIVLAEADPAHLHDMRAFLAGNAIPAEDLDIVEAAISNENGTRLFHVTPENAHGQHGRRDEYGQFLIPAHANGKFTDSRTDYFGAALLDSEWKKQAVQVACMPMRDLLQRYDSVDLVNMDIQREEFNAVQNGLDELNARVRMLHISTHAPDIEQHLLNLLSGNGWHLRYQFGCARENDTPYGRFAFVDGRQSWINSRKI